MIKKVKFTIIPKGQIVGQIRWPPFFVLRQVERTTYFIIISVLKIVHLNHMES